MRNNENCNITHTPLSEILFSHVIHELKISENNNDIEVRGDVLRTPHKHLATATGQTS